MKKKQPFDKSWRTKTIQILEDRDYGNPDEAPTGMVKRCLKLCRIPLDEFTIDDLRLMIGQSMALKYLIPLAIEHLQIDIFSESLYPGDLLEKILKIDPDFWRENKTLWSEVDALLKNNRAELTNHKISTVKFDSAF